VSAAPAQRQQKKKKALRCSRRNCLHPQIKHCPVSNIAHRHERCPYLYQAVGKSSFVGAVHSPKHSAFGANAPQHPLAFLPPCPLPLDFPSHVTLRSFLGLIPFRSLIEDSGSIVLEWTSWNDRHRVGLHSYLAPDDSEDACVIDMPGGGVHFFATVEDTSSGGHLEGEQRSLRSYRIYEMKCPPSPISSVQPNLEPTCIHDLEAAPYLVTHPSLPLLFAFTPKKIVVIFFHGNADPANPFAVQQIDVNLPVAPPPSSGGLWGLAVSVKALVGFSGSRSAIPTLCARASKHCASQLRRIRQHRPSSSQMRTCSSTQHSF
jgi:hypothetical protein